MELLTKSSPQLKRLQVLASDRLFGLVRISRMELQDYKTVDRESEFLVLCFLSSIEPLTKSSAPLQRLQALASRSVPTVTSPTEMRKILSYIK